MRTISRFGSLCTALLLCAMALGMTALAAEANVGGSISYSGSKSGPVYLVLQHTYEWNRRLGSSVPPQTASYGIAGVPDGTYDLYAFMDTVGNGQRHASDPAVGPIPVTVANGTAMANITLADPPSVSPDPPGPFNAIPTPCGTFLMWEAAHDPNSQALAADSYNIYWSTSPQFTPQTAQGSKTGIRADSENNFFVHNGSGTYYYLMTATSAGNVSAPSAIVGPLTVPVTPVGGHTVSGKFILDKSLLPAFIPTGPLYVVITDDNGKFFFNKIDTPTFTNNQEAFTVPGVSNGSYFVYFFIDMNNDGILTYGDLFQTGESPLITVSNGDLTVPDITLRAVNAAARVTTHHGRNEYGDYYNVDVRIEGVLKQPVNVTLTGKPASVMDQPPLEIGINPEEGDFDYAFYASWKPSGSDLFTFDIAYPGSSDTGVQAPVTGVVDSFSTPVAPRGFVLVPPQGEAAPNFTWTAPTPALAGGYSYNLWLNQQGNNGDNGWWVDTLPAGTTSVPYNFDQSGPALSLDTVYQWGVRVRDAFGNQSELQNNYTFKPVTAIPVPQVFSYPNGGSEGNTLYIGGDNFSSDPAANQVLFFDGSASTLPGTIVTADFNQLQVIVPQGVQNGPVLLKNDPSGQPVTITDSFTVYPPQPPYTYYITPTSGPVGSQVTISGWGFNPNPGATTVTFSNGVAATISSIRQDQIVVSVPAGAVTGPVSVTTAGGTATSYDAFTVTVPISFSGFTKTSAGTPVAGAAVQVVNDPSLSAVSAADGSFTIAGIPPALGFTLKATAPGFTDVYYGPQGSSVNITGRTLTFYTPAETATWGLSAGTGAITGQVIVAGAAVPLQGVTVNILSPSGKYTVTYDGGGSSTGPTGAFRINGVSTADTVTMTAFKTGWNFGQKVVTVYGNGVTEGNLAAASITYTGTLKDSSGNPVSGATIEMEGYPAIKTTTAADGTFLLKGLPSGNNFTLKMSKSGFVPTYSSITNSTTNITASSAYAIYTAAELAGWGITPGKGAIRSRVTDNNPSPVNVDGAVVTATSAFHPQTPYQVVYFDGSSYGGSATFTNGVYLVKDVDEGDTVTVTAAKTGWNFSPRTFLTHADAVGAGRVVGMPLVPAVTVTPPSFDFGSVTTGTTSYTQTLTFANTGTASLTVTAAGMSGPNAGMFSAMPAGYNPCPMLPADFAPGQSCTLGVTFSPTSTGPMSATLTVTSNDPVSPTLSVPLSGTGTPPPAPYINSFYPANGMPGTQVSIYGSNFSPGPANNTVQFNGITALVTYADYSLISATVPVGATSGPISVTTVGGTATGGMFTVDSATTLKNPMPAARQSAAAAAANGMLYVAGGHDGSHETATLQAYDPATDNWSTLATMPGGRYGGNGADVIAGKIYVAGGWDNTSTSLPHRELFAYDLATGSWSTLANMPTLSACGATGAINGKLYVTTACDGYSGYRNLLHAYDPATNAWSSLASSPVAHGSPAAGVIDGKLYVAGGADGAGYASSQLDVYDPATNTWATRSPMPVAGLNFAAGVAHGKLYVAGGTNGAGSNFDAIYEYTPQTDSWKYIGSLQTQRSSAAAGVTGGTLYVAGGANASGLLASVEAYTPPVAPTITSFTPDSGSMDTAVTITGSGFGTSSMGSAVQFNGYYAYMFSSWTDTQIVAMVPSIAMGSGPITVTTPGGTATSSTNFTVTQPVYVPVINSFSPTAAAPGSQVVITGSNFDYNPQNVTVRFNGIPASVTYATWDTLAVIVPNGVTSGPITVTTLSGTATSSTPFTVSPLTTYTDNAAFSAAFPATNGVDFESINTTGGKVAFNGNEFGPLGISFSISSGAGMWVYPSASYWNSNHLSPGEPPYGQGDDNWDSLTITLNPPVKAVGWNFVDLGGGYGEGIRVYAQDNSLIYQQDFLPGTGIGSGNNPFWGLSSPDRPIARVEIIEASGDGDDVAYDNFRFVVQAPPAQSSKVLVAGGLDQTSTAPPTAEVYDETSGTWTPTANNVAYAAIPAGGIYAANMALLGNGKVLMAGGGGGDNHNTTNAASIYDPATNQWSTAASMAYGRNQLALLPLADGNALAIAGCAGGCSGPNALGQYLYGGVGNSAELYSATGNTWTTTANLTSVRGNLAQGSNYQSAIRLKDNRVLVCGGTDGFSTTWSTCEIFDPAANTWTGTGSFPEPGGAAKALLPDGKVLAVLNQTTGAVLFDPATGVWSPTGTPLSRQISGQLTVLGTGEVLLSGGYDANLPLNTAQIYTPATGTWRPAAPLGTHRYGHAATLLGNGKVLVAGGANDFVAGQWVPTASAELFDPATGTWSPTGAMSQPRYFTNATLLQASVTPATASGTYSYTAGTLSWNWTASTFPCDGPSLGPGTKTITTLTATTMSWVDGTDTMTWTRDNGTSGDIVGTWHATDPSTGNSYQLTFNTDGTVSATGTINRCSSGGGPDNPVAQVVNNTGGPLFQAQVGGVVFSENLNSCGDGCSTGFISVPAGSNQIGVQQSAPAAPTTLGTLGNFASGNSYAVNIRNVGGYCAELWQRYDTTPTFNADPTRTLVATTCGGTGDTQAPTVPTGLNATAVSANRVDLNWYASSDNVGVSYYQVYRNGAPAGTPAGPTNTFWPDYAVVASTTYTYTVAACDAAGNCSAPSSAVTVTTPPGAALPQITGFNPASGIVGAQITITGSNFDPVPSNNIVKFNGVTATVSGGGPGQLFVYVPAGTTSGPITVTNGGGTATSSGSFTVNTATGILSVSPGTSLAFGSVATGQSSPAQVITFSNSGTGPLNVQQANTTGDVQDFTVQPGGPTPCPQLPATFSPGQSCTLAVTFVPTSSGPRSATLAVVSDATNGPVLNVNLTGTGTQPLVAPLITSAGTATFTVGTAGSFIVTATGNPAPSLGKTGTLPAGVTFNPATGILSGTPAAATGGTYPISFTATNGVAPDATQNFTLTVNYANTAPSLSVSTLGDGSVTKVATLNITGTASSVNGIKSLTVNGTPVAVNAGSFSTAITLAEGPNAVSVVATDMADLATSSTRTITLDTQAPVLTIAAPADNSVVATSNVTVTGSVDTTATVTATVNNGSPQGAAMTGNNFSVTLNLAAGQNTIDVTATDLAGNSNTTKRTITYDPTAPSLQVTNPAQDITITQSTLLVTGTVSDTYSGVTVTVAVDGQTYTPPVTNGAFQQQLTFSTSKQYAITVTATDQGGTSATVQRNVIVSVPSGATVDLGSAGGVRGGTVNIPVTLTNVAGTGIAAVSVDIAYDPNVLLTPTAVIGAAGTAAGKSVNTSTPAPGVFRVGVVGFNTTAIGNGVVATVTFTVAPGAAPGSVTLANTPSAADTASPSNPVVVTGKNGAVNVITKAGDLNGDGQVTISEVQTAITMYLGLTAAAGSVDISGDGKVSISEVQKSIVSYLGL